MAALLYMNVESPLMGEILADALQADGTFRVFQTDSPDKIMTFSMLPYMNLLLMEVSDHAGYSLADRLRVAEAVRKVNPGCRIVLLVNAGIDRELAREVMEAKMKARIDEFLYDSAGLRYSSALLEALDGAGRKGAVV